MSRGLGLDELAKMFTASARATSSEVPTSSEVAVEPVLHRPQARRTEVEPSSWLLKPEAEWGWQELRDYIIAQSIRRHGAVPRNPVKEASIVKAFMERWGDIAIPIAKRAFDGSDGVWHRAPVRIEHFAKASDDYFAAHLAVEVR
jgi:hypothetical protein